jgi:hypothetical protein
VILNVSMSKFRISSGSIYCAFLRGFVFGIRYLYLSYSHIIYVVCLRSRWCCVPKLMLYCFQSYSRLVLGIVIRRLPMSINMWASSHMICMVGCVVFMSLSGLLLGMCIWINGRLSGLCTYLVSFDCG